MHVTAIAAIAQTAGIFLLAGMSGSFCRLSSETNLAPQLAAVAIMSKSFSSTPLVWKMSPSMPRSSIMRNASCKMALLAQCGGSFEAYFDSLIKTQQERPERYASFALPKLDVENRLIVKSPN